MDALTFLTLAANEPNRVLYVHIDMPGSGDRPNKYAPYHAGCMASMNWWKEFVDRAELEPREGYIPQVTHNECYVCGMHKQGALWVK